MTLTELRKNIYSVFNEVVTKGKTIEVKSKGRSVYISPGYRKNKLELLQNSAAKKAIVGNPDDLIKGDWEKEWQPHI